MLCNFKPHGQLQIHRDCQILVSEIAGPWNIELLELMRNALTPYAAELRKNGRGGCITIITESMLSSPEAMIMLRKLVKSGVENFDFAGQAIIAEKNVIGRGLVEPIFYPAYKNQCPFQFFYDYDAAKFWLTELVA